MNSSLRSIALAVIIAMEIAPESFSLEKNIDGTKLNFNNQKLAIAGDFMTEQRLYSTYIEIYLRVTNPDADMKIIQYGWSDEQAVIFLQRMDADILSWKPGIVTLCYGMNDGGFVKYNDGMGNVYEKSLRSIVKKFADSGSTVIVGSPGVADPDIFKRPTVSAADYNEKLGKLAGITKKIAEEFKMPYADVNGVMMKSMTDAKAALGDSYHIASGYCGMYPTANGHLAAAYAFLIAMGVDGNIGKINMDFKSGKAEATEGHKILKSEPGKAEIQSSKYPFCFESGPKSPASILPFVPFQEDLNRLTLVVTNLPSDKAEIIWGNAKKTFTKEQLEKGVNLAAEFVADNPFKKPFFEVMANVQEKQAFDNAMIKKVLTVMRHIDDNFKDDREIENAENVIRKKLFEKNEMLQKKIIKSVKPIVHEIKVVPLK